MISSHWICASHELEISKYTLKQKNTTQPTHVTCSPWKPHWMFSTSECTPPPSPPNNRLKKEEVLFQSIIDTKVNEGLLKYTQWNTTALDVTM